MWELRGQKNVENFQVLSLGKCSLMVVARQVTLAMYEVCGQARNNVSDFGFVEFRALVGHPCGEIQWHMDI